MFAKQAYAASELEVFTWSDYKEEDLHADFVEKFGASPNFSVLSDNGDAFQKIRAGYKPDIAGPTSMFLNQWAEAGILKEVDVSKLAHWDDMFPALRELEGVVQDGAVMGVPFVWGTSSVLFRADLAPEYVGKDSWSILWDPKYKGRLSQRDAAHAAALQAALVLGRQDFYSMTAEDLPMLRDKLAEQRELLRYYWSSQTDIEQALASGELVAAYAWPSSLKRLRAEGIDVQYMTPSEGILTWVDTHVLIEGGGASEEEQYAYLNAISTAEVGKTLIEKYGYGASNQNAFDLVEGATIAELGMTDPGDMLANSVAFQALETDFQSELSRTFEEVKAGL